MVRASTLPRGKKRLLIVPGKSLLSDNVYYDSRDGLLVAEFVEARPHALRLHVLGPSVLIEVDEEGLPVSIEVLGDQEFSWGRRDTVEVQVPITAGRVRFEGPLDYDYWHDEPPVVTADRTGRYIMIQLEESPPARGVRISPRVTVMINESGNLWGFYFEDVESR